VRWHRVGILKYAHDTDGTAVESFDLSDERERLERAQRDLSRKEHGSTNWEKQRRVVAERHAELKNKRRDFLHKLSNYYAREYDFVAVEDLDVKGLIELPGNSRNRAGAAWGTFLRMLEYKCEREGTYFIAVNPRGTTKECASCDASTEKPLWVREHSCPACGFEADRDANAAWNILSRGITKRLGAGRSESTPVETALPCGYLGICKARRGNRKPHPQARAVRRAVGWGSSRWNRTRVVTERSIRCLALLKSSASDIFFDVVAVNTEHHRTGQYKRPRLSTSQSRLVRTSAC